MTNKLNTQPYKGARDFYPEDMAIQNYIFDTWKKVCSSYGFEQYDFPIIEPLEIFAAKTGQEIVNEQLFSFEDKGQRQLAIRPELTPGTVRMIAQRYKKLQKPIKWFMIGNNWRFEKPQLGRGREFNQLEVNIFGINEVIADYEIFSIIINIMKEFGANETMFSVKISDRRLINALLKDSLAIDINKQENVRRIMDKKAKLTQQEFKTELIKLGITNDQIQKIYMFMESTLNNLSNVIPQKILDTNEGYLALNRLFELLKNTKLDKYCVFDPSIIRGFDYSDGIVYEVFDKSPKNNRSMFGGERFDKLINIFGEFDLPATGFAMGDVTLLEFLKAWDLLPNTQNVNSCLVTLWPTEDIKLNDEYLIYSMRVSKELRTRGYQVDTWLESNTKIEKQLKYADRKNISNVVLLGPDELKNNTVTIKNMKTGTQETKYCSIYIMLRLYKYVLGLIIFSFVLVVFNTTTFAETAAPITTYAQTPNIPDGSNDWYITPVSFELFGNDLDSGIHQIFYQIDSGTWQNATFSDTQNEILNPSFEIPSSAFDTNLLYWEESVSDENVTYQQDASDSGFGSYAVKIQTTQGQWHGVTNKGNYIPVEPYDSMTASVFLKTLGTINNAGFKIYVVKDNAGELVYEQLTQSEFITTAPNWQRIALSFTVNDPDAIGIYIDIGLEGAGTIWADAAYVSNSLTDTKVQFTIGDDNDTHQVAFYSVDNDGNTESYTCSLPAKNCISFKLDQTAPTNWRGSGAIRGLFGNNYDLWVFTLVDDDTSGLDTNNAKYMYHTELNTGFGRFNELLSCSSSWQPDTWTDLNAPFVNQGDPSAYVVTDKTSFCNNNWKQCKIVRFYTQDMAGNSSTKDFCINGPWIKSRGMGIVRSNSDIDMLSEAYGYNTDGLIEIKGSSIGFFSSTKGWKTTGASTLKNIGYDELYDLTGAKTEKYVGDPINPESGVFVRNYDAILNSATLPEGYDTTEYNKIIFVNGSLTIDTDVDILEESTILFVVKGNVYISKNVINSDFGIIADGDVYTAYDVLEGEATEALTLNGIYTANKFIFQRTLQGTDNDQNPSEVFNFEPKYAEQLKQFFIKSTVKWIEND